MPKTTAGRFCGVAIMFTGIAVLGVLAGSLASLFNLEPRSAAQPADEAAPAPPTAVPAELAMLQVQLREVERRLGELAERISTRLADPG